MANGQVVPEELIAQIVAGQQAQSQLGPIQEQMNRVDALRQYAPPQGRGMGGVYQAANPLAHIGALMSSIGGQRKFDKLSDQAGALRGTATEGAAAETRAKFLQDQAMQDIRGRTRDTADLNATISALRAETGAQSAAHKQGIAEKNLVIKEQAQDVKEANQRLKEQQQEWKQAEADLKRNFLVGSAEEYVTPEGDVIQVGRDSESYKNLSEDGYPEISLKGLRKVTKDDKSAAEGLPAKDKSHIFRLRKSYDDLNNIRDLAGKLSSEDVANLSRPGEDVAYKVLTPAAMETYIQNNQRNLSADAKEYLRSIAAFSAELRNRLFGSALTVNESVLAEAFLPSAVGLNFSDRMGRINAYAKEFDRWSTAYDRDIYRNMRKYEPWEASDTPVAKGGSARKQLWELTDDDINAMTPEQRDEYLKSMQ